MIVCNVAIVFVIVVYFTVYYFNIRDHEITALLNNLLNSAYEGINLLIACILAYAALRILKIIKSLHSGFFNEKFIRVHLANSIIYAVMYLIIIILDFATRVGHL